MWRYLSSSNLPAFWVDLSFFLEEVRVFSYFFVWFRYVCNRFGLDRFWSKIIWYLYWFCLVRFLVFFKMESNKTNWFGLVWFGFVISLYYFFQILHSSMYSMLSYFLMYVMLLFFQIKHFIYYISCSTFQTTYKLLLIHTKHWHDFIPSWNKFTIEYKSLHLAWEGWEEIWKLNK